MNTILKYAKKINKDTIVLIILSDGTATCTRKDGELLSIVLPNYYNKIKINKIEKIKNNNLIDIIVGMINSYEKI